MLKKNTRKRLLAGALATVMMLTMCPSWALADDEDIAAPLPLVDENRPVAESAPVEADTTETPADPTPSEPEAKPAEGQDTAPAPSEGGANGGTDSTESGNSTNPTVPEGSGNISQKNDAVSSSPDVNDQPQDAANEANSFIDGLDLTMEASAPKTIKAEYWITNAPATDANGDNTLTISSDMDHITDEGGIPVNQLAPPTRTDIIGYETTVFGHARVLPSWQHQEAYRTDRSTSGTEIDAIRFKYNQFQYRNKANGSWHLFISLDQLVFYYLVRTDYSKMVQIDVSDWAYDDLSNEVDDTYRSNPDHRSVTYQVIVMKNDGTEDPADSRKFWYNRPLTVSLVAVREIDSDYTIHHIALEPSNLGSTGDKANGEYKFSLDLSKTKDRNATVKIYVESTKQPHTLTYNEDGGKITSDEGNYTPAGDVYPKQTIIVPEVEKKDYTFVGWFDEETGIQYETGAPMPDKNLVLKAHWTANPPVTPPVDPEVKKYEAKYFVLLPNRGEPESGASQGWTNYLPNETSDGGVMDATRVKGYAGYLTEAGKEAAVKGEFNANGVNRNYLLPPSDLGFFTASNWNGSTYIGKTKHSPEEIKNLLKTAKGDFDVTKVQVVWYTVKYESTDGYHVDGYVAGVPITVTYHSNYGTIPGTVETTSVKDATSGKEYTVLQNMFTVPNGYTFGGWYTDPDYTKGTEKAVGSDELLMTDLHLYAKWNPINSEVSYFYQNEQGNATQFGDIDTYAFGTDVTVRTAHPEKEGYTFTGWTNIANIVTVDADGKFTMPAQDVRFDAQFSINQYHVTYKVDGKDYGNTETYVFNSDVAIRPVPTKEGYTFTGWKIGTADAENFKMPAHDVTIEGTFAINRYTVTYKVDTEVVGTDVYDFNSDVVIRDVPTKEGYTFSGWKIGTADAENFKMPAHDVIIEGTFAKNSSGGHHRKPTVTIPDKVPTGLNGNDHYAYIVGYPDKTVRPQNGITRAEVATIFFRLLTDETRNANSTKSNSYSDVAAGAWYNHAVSTLSAMGIVKGDSNGKFNPNAPITRAEFAAIAARFDDKANSTTADFSDIVSHWAKNEISAASNNGWINGYPDGTFRPDNKITRAEAMTLVNRVLKRLPETAEDLHDDMIKWSDNSDASQWFYLAVQEATNSHYYKAKENKSEKWTELRDTRDWTELEK